MDYAAQGRGWQGHISFKKVSLAKDTTLMGTLWPWGSLITQVNSLDRDKWLSAVRCLYWISSKGSGYPAYTSKLVQNKATPFAPMSHSRLRERRRKEKRAQHSSHGRHAQSIDRLLFQRTYG